jgi:replication factor C small subunit
MENYLWTERYRPRKLEDYVFTDDNQRNQIYSWVKDGNIPHILLSGSAGVGKTTLAKVLFNELDIDGFDILEINASRDNGVDFIRDRIEGFVSTMPFGKFKVVLLDEADYLSQNAQAVLRGLMETYSSTSRFILTCNLPHKIIPPIHSRCQSFHIDKTDLTEFTARMAQILINENITFDLDILDNYVRATYPDLRKCINAVQLNSSEGSLLSTVGNGNKKSDDYKVDAIALFKSGKFRDARKMIASQIRPDEIDEMYRWFYDNLDLWSQTEEGQDQAILIIKKAMVDHTLCADPEINLAAAMIELSQVNV